MNEFEEPTVDSGENKKKNILGNYLRNLRNQHALTAETLAEQLSFGTKSISAHEGGRRIPKVENLQEYSKFYNIEYSLLEDLREKQLKLNEDCPRDTNIKKETAGAINELVDLLSKVEDPLVEELVESFKKQVNTLLLKMIEHYSLTDLRMKYRKEVAFEQNSTENSCIEGFLKSSEDTQLFFRLKRFKATITLELLQANRSKIDMFEKWMGPHSYSTFSHINVPQVTEMQKGISFTWFSAETTTKDQVTHIKNSVSDIDKVVATSPQLIWLLSIAEENEESIGY